MKVMHCVAYFKLKIIKKQTFKKIGQIDTKELNVGL